MDPERSDDCRWSRSDGLSSGDISFQHCDCLHVRYEKYMFDIIADAGADGGSHLSSSLPTPLLCYSTLRPRRLPPTINILYLQKPQLLLLDT